MSIPKLELEDRITITAVEMFYADVKTNLPVACVRRGGWIVQARDSYSYCLVPHPGGLLYLVSRGVLEKAVVGIERPGEGQIYPKPELPVKVVVANMLENCKALRYTAERTAERLLESLTITRKGGTK